MQSTEASVLGAALAETGLWLSEADRINPGLFVEYRSLAKMLCRMTAEGHPTDPQAVKAWCDSHDQQISVADLLQIAELAPASKAGMESAVNTLVDRAKRAALQKLGNLLSATAFNAKHRADDLVQESINKLAEIGARSTRAVEPLSALLPSAVKTLSQPPKDGIKTGIGTFDNLTGGFRPGQLIVLGARPSMGKTALAIGAIRQAAFAGKTVALFSLEMSTGQIIHRLLSQVGDIDLARISTHRLSQHDMTAVVNAAARLHEARVFIGETDQGLAQVCMQLKHQHALDLIVIDYLQLMSIKAESREQQIATISRNLKRLARQLGVPILVLSQLNRSLEARQNKRPQLSDLRESGAIEQDADVVLLLWRESYYDADADPAEAELVVAKQRNGPVGTLALSWDETRAKFTQAKRA